VIVLGIGLGGFADGILLHMILQWHHMISHRIPPDTMPGMEINMLWDGIFHVFTWIMCIVGIGLLWSAARSTSNLLSLHFSSLGLRADFSTRSFPRRCVI
jgi:uncharacterized membrane protein